MNAEYIQLVRDIRLAALASTIIEFESGTPFRHFVIWIHVSQVSTPDIDAQPIYAGENDGGLVNVTSTSMTKVFQVPVDEIRPATRGLIKHSDDTGPAFSAKPGIKLTNSHLTDGTIISVYMMAAAAPGGA